MQSLLLLDAQVFLELTNSTTIIIGIYPAPTVCQTLHQILYPCNLMLSSHQPYKIVTITHTYAQKYIHIFFYRYDNRHLPRLSANT